jgi:hypothetical protein
MPLHPGAGYRFPARDIPPAKRSARRSAKSVIETQQKLLS